MTNRLHIVWLCLPLLCSCSLDSTPRGGSDSDGRRGPGWTPAGASTSGEQQGSIDSDNPVEPAKNGPATSSNKPDAGSRSDSQNSQDDPSPSTSPGPSAPSTPNTPSGGTAAPAVPAAPAAESGGASAVDSGSAAAGSGGTGPAQEAGGAGGAAGAEAESIRQRFIDAAIEAIGGGANGNQDGGTEPWRRSGTSEGGLSPDFVLPVLLTMRNSAVCFRDVRRCVQMCVVLSSDCKPCAADPECGQALKDVCGPTLGSCGNP